MTAAWLAWLGATPWSVALRESIWVYPLVETAHVLGLAPFVGLAVILDLRLMGRALLLVRVTELVKWVGPWMAGAFGLMMATGLLLFAADPVKCAANPYFRAKLVLLAIAGGNAAVFHATVHRRVARWDDAVSPPRAARVAGLVSLAVWIAVIAVGRLIAFYEP